MAEKKTAEKPEKPAKPQAYRVVHTAVGLHRQGEVFHFTPDQLATGHDPARLLRIGAVEETEGRSVPYGQTAIEMPRPYPAVPWQATPVDEYATLTFDREVAQATEAGRPGNDQDGPVDAAEDQADSA